MEHRHLNAEPNRWSVAVIHSIWERGSDADIRALIRAVRIHPEAANAVRKAIAHSRVYGWPKFFEMYLEKHHDKGR